MHCLLDKILGRRNGILYVTHGTYRGISLEFYDECKRRNIQIKIVDKHDKRRNTFVQVQQRS